MREELKEIVLPVMILISNANECSLCPTGERDVAFIILDFSVVDNKHP